MRTRRILAKAWPWIVRPIRVATGDRGHFVPQVALIPTPEILSIVEVWPGLPRHLLESDGPTGLSDGKADR